MLIFDILKNFNIGLPRLRLAKTIVVYCSGSFAGQVVMPMALSAIAILAKAESP
jgi:hypothetical protein